MSSTEQTPRATPRSRPNGMIVFAAIFLLLHVPLFIYPVLRLSSWLDLSWVWTLAILIPVTASQIVSRWLLRDAKTPLVRLLRKAADFWLGLSPILVMTLLVFELLVVLGFLQSPDAAIWVIGMTVCISLCGLALAMRPMVKTVSFDSTKLRSPLKFVQITDVHIGSRDAGFLRHIVDRIKLIDPEFLCITGDFIDASGIGLDQLQPLTELFCPIYFTTGNHERYEDFDDILTRLRSLGVKVLRSETIAHRLDVQIVGIDDRDAATQVEDELANITVKRDALSILMYHRPQGLEAADRAGIDLMISGHTHNGQIFPFNFAVSRVFKRVVGMYQFGDARLYVSQGTGTWGPIMRVGTRGEITLFELGCA